MQQFKLLKKDQLPLSLSRTVERELRIAQIIRLYPSDELRKELKALILSLEVSESGTGQLFANFTHFGVCSLDWHAPREEYLLDRKL